MMCTSPQPAGDLKALKDRHCTALRAQRRWLQTVLEDLPDMVLRETCAQHASTWLIKENVHIMCICLYQIMHSLDLRMVSYKAGRHRMEGKAGFSIPPLYI